MSIGGRNSRFFNELTPFANAICALHSNLERGRKVSKLGNAQRKRKRKRKAQKALEQQRNCNARSRTS